MGRRDRKMQPAMPRLEESVEDPPTYGVKEKCLSRPGG